MTTYLLSIFQIWRNPVFIRFCRSQLRLRKSIFWYLLTLIITTFVITLLYIIRTNSGDSAQEAARVLWLPLLIIQGVILMAKGTGDVSAGLIQDKIDQTLDYQRLTPMTPLRSLIGYLFGLPIQEYVLVALTLPHLLFVVIVGRIPLGALGSIYLIFFSCVVLYHLIGIAAGMVMRRWIWGYLLSIFLVVFVNGILPTFIAQLGLSFLRYLSIWPVVGQKLLPVMLSPRAVERLSDSNPFFSMADAVPFFNWELSAFAFTLMLQGALIVTFFVMALRRWESASRHLLSKPFALVFLCGFLVLVLGNLWPAITGRSLPFALFGNSSIEDLKDVVGTALPLVYVLVVWGLCMMLLSITIPSHHDYLRGIRQALKRGRAVARPWQDDSASLTFMSLFVVVALLGYWILFGELSQAGLRDTQIAAGTSSWHLPVVLGLVVFYTILLLQVVEMRRAMLVALLLWLLPILVAIIWSANTQELTSTQTVLASLSPFALVLMAGVLPIEGFLPDDVGGGMSVVLTGVYTGLLFVCLQIGVLWWRWRVLQRSFRVQSQATN